jgi:hypothetical protein
MPIAAAWVALVIFGFWMWWPLGLGILAFTIGSRRMGCWSHHGWSHHGWDHDDWDHRGMARWQHGMERMQEGMDRMRAKMEKMRSRADWWNASPSSGNRAFDDYRSDTLRRLEEEQREFKDFLERLRFAKDRSEFDQFMAERRDRPHDEGPSPPPQQP